MFRSTFQQKHQKGGLLDEMSLDLSVAKLKLSQIMVLEDY